MLSNAYFLVKFRFHTAENEPAKTLQNFASRFPRSGLRAARLAPGRPGSGIEAARYAQLAARTAR